MGQERRRKPNSNIDRRASIDDGDDRDRDDGDAHDDCDDYDDYEVYDGHDESISAPG